MTAPRSRDHRAKQLDAGSSRQRIGSSCRRLATEGKSAGTVRTYIEAAAWFVGAYLLERTSRSAW